MKIASLIFVLSFFCPLSYAAEDFVLEKHMKAGVEKFFGILFEGKPMEKSLGGQTAEEYSKDILKQLSGRDVYSENFKKRIRANQPIRKQQFYIDRVNKMLKGAAFEKFGKQYINYFKDEGVSVGEKEVVCFLLATVTLTKVNKTEYPELNGASHEELADHYLEALTQYTQASLNITDVKSAELAAEKFAELADKLVYIGKVLSVMQTPSDEVRAKVQVEREAIAKGFLKVLDEMRSENKIEPAASVVLTAALKEFIEKIEAASGEFTRHFGPEKKDK